MELWSQLSFHKLLKDSVQSISVINSSLSALSPFHFHLRFKICCQSVHFIPHLGFLLFDLFVDSYQLSSDSLQFCFSFWFYISCLPLRPSFSFRVSAIFFPRLLTSHFALSFRYIYSFQTFGAIANANPVIPVHVELAIQSVFNCGRKFVR
jgi:hypothetical protein